MSHALIIDDNMVVGRAIQSRLAALGFDSFDHTWTEQQALDAAVQRRPDLVVMGAHVVSGSPLEISHEVASASDAPILTVTADHFMFQHSVRDGGTLDGPHPLSELDAALATVGTLA
jgi:DNA-binding response OmpR family regulator